MNESDHTRTKILGVLIRDARQHAGRSLADCAAALRLSEAAYEQVELGETQLALPDLEVLAMFLKVPLAHFWGDSTLSTNGTADFGTLLSLRHRVVGAILRQTRLANECPPEDLAAVIGGDVARLEAYETGRLPIPLFELERLGRHLGVSITHFVDDDHGPLARHEAEQRLEARFNELPDDVKKFVTEPVNIAYLETAMRLSDMDADKLRGIAESILEITF